MTCTQNCPGHQKRGKSENLSAKGTKGDLMTKCNVVSCMGPWNRKRALGKN